MGKMTEFLRAGYSRFYVKSKDPAEAIKWIKGEAEENGMPNKVWGCIQSPYETVLGELPKQNDALMGLVELDKEPLNTILICKNLHWFLKDQNGTPNYDLVQFIMDRFELYQGKKSRRVLVIVGQVSMVNALPADLVDHFISIEHDLPSTEEVDAILEKTIQNALGNPKFKVPTTEERKKLVEAATGMPRADIENSFFLSLVRKASLDRDEIIKLRAEFLENVAGVKFLQYEETLDSLKGYGKFKKFVMRTIVHKLAKGVLIVGPPGVGKTHFCRGIASATGYIMLTIEMAEWSGGIVGETEEKVRNGIAAIKQMAKLGKVIVFVDEIEKGLAGAKAGSSTVSSDSITQKAMAQFLKFMADPGENVYFIATCNAIKSMPPEYIRAERFDTAPFMIDLPNVEERAEILDYYKGVYKVDGDPGDTEGWTGAELKAVCRLSVMMDRPLEVTRDYVLPISATMGEEITELRTWAKGRAIPASFEIKKENGTVVDLDRAVNF